ncbi:MAG: 50S ribosomal protein L15e [Candidatus Woesearchaeota archaeon]
MGLYKYVRNLWKKPKENLSELWQQRLIQWRQEPVTLRIDKPTRIDRARELGYKAIQGVFVVRQRVSRGGRMRPTIRKARRPKAQRQRKILEMNYQTIAEQRANKKFPNCEVLNSYWVGEDGTHLWYEVIMVDKNHPEVLSRHYFKWLKNPANRSRVFRGLTSSARKSRGLRNKGKGAEKVRPSRNANNSKLNKQNQN